jgi:hypothetical protein
MELTQMVLARAAEQLRQEQETFNQAKQHERQWFLLRLAMGYSAIALLTAVMGVASYILFDAAAFSVAVVSSAGAALFVDILGLFIGVWKIALNPNFNARLAPITQVALQPDGQRTLAKFGTGEHR